MQLPRSIRVVLLTVLCFILNIPYGIDVPYNTEVQSTSLDGGAVVCTRAPEGYTTEFTIQCRQTCRPFIIRNGSPFIKLKVFIMDEDQARFPDDVLNYVPDGSDWDADYDPKDYYREHILYEDVFPSLDADYTYEILDDPILVRDGDEFVYRVCVTLPGNTPAGVYSLVFQTEYCFTEFIYKDVLIVR